MANQLLQIPSGTLVADTSVLINLHESKFLDKILNSIPNEIQITKEVLTELSQGPERPALLNAIRSGRIECANLNSTSLSVFEDLVIGTVNETLDDGEASTIAHAHSIAGIALMDERKANRICAERYPQLLTIYSVELFRSQNCATEIGPELLTEAVFNALRYGRMRVPNQHEDWVVGLIGVERAALCPSLSKLAREAY